MSTLEILLIGTAIGCAIRLAWFLAVKAAEWWAAGVQGEDDDE